VTKPGGHVNSNSRGVDRQKDALLDEISRRLQQQQTDCVLEKGIRCASTSRRKVANESFVRGKISPIALAPSDASCRATDRLKRSQGYD